MRTNFDPPGVAAKFQPHGMQCIVGDTGGPIAAGQGPYARSAPNPMGRAN